MTPAERHDDNALWDEVHARLVRYSASLGVGYDNAEDIAQETIGRAIARNVPFVDRDDLLRWCQRVAHNQAMDEHRRRRRVLPFSDTDDGEPAKDVAEQVMSRDLLERTLHALAGLADGQREAILSLAREDAPATGDRKEQVRLAVARSRARVHLRAAVGYAGVIVGALLSPLRRFVRLTPATTVSAAAVIAASMATTSTTLHSTYAPPTPHQSAAAARHFDQKAEKAGAPAPHRRALETPRRDDGGRTPAAKRSGGGLAHVEHAGAVADARHRPQQPGEHLICVTGGPLAGPVCVG